MTGPVQLAAVWGVAVTTLASCGSTSSIAPTPRPAPSSPVAGIDPCTLISAQEVSQATGVRFGEGREEVFHAPPNQPTGPACGFVAVQPTASQTPEPDGLVPAADSSVDLTLITRMEFDHAASLVRGMATAVHPITVSGADAAVELIGPDQGIVYARRGVVNFQVSVGRGKGADPTAEERIAAIVLTHLR
jgi:hypothetical protein